MNLNKKIFLAFFMFIIVPLCSLGFTTYLLLLNLIEEKYAAQSELMLKAIDSNIHLIFKEANYFSDFWAVWREGNAGMSLPTQVEDSSIQPQSPAPEESQSSVYNIIVESGKMAEKGPLTYPPIKSAYLYKSNKDVVSFNVLPDNPLPYDEFVQTEAYKEAKKLNGAPVWVTPFEDPKLNGQYNLFVQIRVAKDFYSLDEVGVLMIRFQVNGLDQVFENFNLNHRNQRYFILNREGTIIYDSKQQLNGTPFKDQVSENLVATAQYDTKKVSFQGNESLISVFALDVDTLGVPGLKLVSVTPWAYLSGDTVFILKWTGGIILACLICALLFNLLFVNRNVRVIVRVVNAMRRVERGNLDTRIVVDGNDETTVLSKGFNSLVERISELLQTVKYQQRRKMQAEMMLLQAQIKPHFLFNMLESINALAVQNQGKKVSQMIKRIAGILRISVHSREEIPLAQEIEHLIYYLEIQQFRFEDLFEFTIDIPENLMDCMILKLTLQPLVENSIQHGFEGIAYKGLIHVSAREEEGNIMICVQDNGIGMSNETLARFRYKLDMDESLVDPIAVNGERRGLGVGNVADRTRIRYGSRYGLFICSAPGQGTIIQCVIPKIMESDGHEIGGNAG